MEDDWTEIFHFRGSESMLQPCWILTCMMAESNSILGLPTGLEGYTNDMAGAGSTKCRDRSTGYSRSRINKTRRKRERWDV